jgi:hypothetical protein
MRNVGEVIYYMHNSAPQKGKVLSVATINRGRRPVLLFYSVKQNTNNIVSVYPNNVLSKTRFYNLKLKLQNKMNFKKLKNSIENIKELQNLPYNVRKAILGQINTKLKKIT